MCTATAPAIVDKCGRLSGGPDPVAARHRAAVRRVQGHLYVRPVRYADTHSVSDAKAPVNHVNLPRIHTNSCETDLRIHAKQARNSANLPRNQRKTKRETCLDLPFDRRICCWLTPRALPSLIEHTTNVLEELFLSIARHSDHLANFVSGWVSGTMCNVEPL